MQDLKYLFTLIKNASKDVASIRARRLIGVTYILVTEWQRSFQTNWIFGLHTAGREMKREVLLLVSKPAFLNASESRCFAREFSESGDLRHW